MTGRCSSSRWATDQDAWDEIVLSGGVKRWWDKAIQRELQRQGTYAPLSSTRENPKGQQTLHLSEDGELDMIEDSTPVVEGKGKR
ncbi:MAG TPA: hypothetical protein PLD47_02475 [Aggregatilineales bacterium]|nr:hypothetical protein [Anaerolineales bacterium]HRE46565.1 hypothetical protein [Aggregatilineales bacterium]